MLSVFHRNMEKKTNKSNYYFTQETEDAIVRYNASSDPVLRSKIFAKHLYQPFYKLAENLIHTFRFYYMDVESIEHLKYDIIAMVAEEKISKFDHTNGAKAFSYFQTIIKRWLINYNNGNYKKLKQAGTFDEMQDSYEGGSLYESQRTVELKLIVDRFVDHCYDNLEELFAKDSEKQVADAVLTLFKTRYDLDIFKKKALYIYIREMTECETPTLTRVVNRLRDEFKEIYSSYTTNGYEIEYNSI